MAVGCQAAIPPRVHKAVKFMWQPGTEARPQNLEGKLRVFLTFPVGNALQISASGRGYLKEKRLHMFGKTFEGRVG